MAPSTAIVYNGGTYGTYLHWVLTTLTKHIPIESPFTSLGNSHLFEGDACNSMDMYRSCVQDTVTHDIVRLHPKTLKTESLTENMNFISATAGKVLYLYPDPDSILLVLNNYMFKVWDDWWSTQFLNHIPKEKIYNNWPVSPDTDAANIPNWIKREFLSFYLMPAWYDQVEWFHPKKWSSPNCQVIFVRDLLTNFENTVCKAVDFLELDIVKPVSSLTASHQANLALQKYTNQDTLCRTIINSIRSPELIDWSTSEVPLASQAYVQWELRNQNLEIRCDGLDIFPTNSVQLKDLIYPQ